MEKRLLFSGARQAVYTWADECGRCPVTEFLDGLQEIEYSKIVGLLRRSTMYGVPRCNRQKCRRLTGWGDLHELKAGQVRLLFFHDRQGDIIVTNGFLKKQDRTPQREIERAVSIREAWEAGEA